MVDGGGKERTQLKTWNWEVRGRRSVRTLTNFGDNCFYTPFMEIHSPSFIVLLVLPFPGLTPSLLLPSQYGLHAAWLHKNLEYELISQ